MKANFAALLAVVAAGLSAAAPTGSDPAFTVPQDQLDANLECPLQPGRSFRGVTNPLLLCPGTGTTGPVSWDHTYVPLSSQLGYQPCYISPPPNMDGDLQDATQYYVNAVQRLRQESGKKVPVMTWSAGGLISQWGLTFYPSIRDQVDRIVAFAPDYRGTVNAFLLTSLQAIVPSIWQQTTTARFIQAMTNAGGQRTFVPTTTIYSGTDEIVQPQGRGPIASSFLSGASNNRIQDVCGEAFPIEHSQHLFNQATYTVAVAALQSSSGQAPAGSLTPANCTQAPPAGLTPADVAYDLTIITQAGGNILADPKTTCEPPLRPYAAAFVPGPAFCRPQLPGEAQFIAALNNATAPFGDAQAMVSYLGNDLATAAAMRMRIPGQ